MLDISRDTYWNAWTPMEEVLGLQQTKIGRRVANFNLKKRQWERCQFLGGRRLPKHMTCSRGRGWW
jgi:predicted nucleic acid-binding Zn ribbon protein